MEWLVTDLDDNGIPRRSVRLVASSRDEAQEMYIDLCEEEGWPSGNLRITRAAC